jgi:hypothetical protein
MVISDYGNDTSGTVANTGKPIRIVILLGAPFTAQNYERVGIPYLSKHFEVLVFDCTEWLGRNIKGVKCKKASWDRLFPIRGKLDLDEQIKKYSPHFAIDFIGFADFTLDICSILAKHNVKFVIQRTGNLPGLTIKMRVINSIRTLFINRKILFRQVESKNNANSASKETVIKRINNLFAKLKRKLHLILVMDKLNSFPDRIGLIAGNKSLDLFTRRCKPIIWIGSHDYHTFNKAKKELTLNKTIEINTTFILFIDDCLPNASDWIVLGMPAPVSEAMYYPALNNFFEQIESIYKMPVRIAGHPNSAADKNYTLKMGGRSVSHGNTAMLTLQSSLVLIHGSTATSFAVLARKPIICLTSRELDQSNYGSHVRVMSESLGCPLVFIDNNENLMDNLKKLYVNERKYELYETNYLHSERSMEIEPWGELVEYIKKTSERNGAVAN